MSHAKKTVFFVLLAAIAYLNVVPTEAGWITQQFTTNSTFTAPFNSTSNQTWVYVQAWGAGGGSGGAFSNPNRGGGGGGGGAYSATWILLNSSQTYSVVVGTGGSGADGSSGSWGANGTGSYFYAPNLLFADGGKGGKTGVSAGGGNGGSGGNTTASNGTTKFNGGNGGSGIVTGGTGGGGGGGGAGNATHGGNGTDGSAAVGGAGGTGGTSLGGNGGTGAGTGGTTAAGNPGSNFGGGAGGGFASGSGGTVAGARGGNGTVLITYLGQDVSVNIFDETSGSPINQAVQIYFTSDVYSTNTSTSNGSTYVTLTNPGNYTVTLTSANYTQRTYVMNITQFSANTLNAYLLNNNTGTFIRFTVLDQSYSVIEDAVVFAQKKNLSGTNYYDVQDCITDNNGECILYLQTLTSTYRFITCVDSVCRTTSDSILSRDTFTIVVNQGTTGLDSLYSNINIQTRLNYSAGVFTFSMADITLNQHDALMYVYRINGNSKILLQTVTGSGSSLTLTSTFENVTLADGLRAEAYVYVNGQYQLAQILSAHDNEFGNSRNSSLLLLFVGLTLCMIFIFSWNPVAPPIIAGVLLYLFQSIGLIQIGIEVVAGFMVLVIIAVWRMRSV